MIRSGGDDRVTSVVVVQIFTCHRKLIRFGLCLRGADPACAAFSLPAGCGTLTGGGAMEGITGVEVCNAGGLGVGESPVAGRPVLIVPRKLRTTIRSQDRHLPGRTTGWLHVRDGQRHLCRGIVLAL